MSKKPVKQEIPAQAGNPLRPLLITPGQFFVLTADDVQVHVLSEDRTTQYWDRVLLSETRIRADVAKQETRRLMFGTENIIDVLPAGSIKALVWYTDHYEGLHAERVKGIAACILTGTPFGPDSANPIDGGGQTVPRVSGPDSPGSPGGVALELSQAA